MGNAMVAYAEEAKDAPGGVDQQGQAELQANNAPTKKKEYSNPEDAGTQHKTPGKTSHTPEKQEESKDDESGKDGDDKEEGGDEGEQEEEEEKKPEIEVKSAPYDHRFPSTNQARHCYTRYNEFHKCAAEKSEDECHFYQKAYRSVCPNDWIERWNEQRDAGTWPGRY